MFLYLLYFYCFMGLKRTRLDYLIIPGGSKGKLKRDRMKRAIKEIKNRVVDKIIILQGKDSEEDILYLGEVLKKGERIGFDTFPLHYKEYKELIKKAKKDKKFPKGVRIENIETSQNFKEVIYGTIGLTEEKVKKRELEYVKNRQDNFWRALKCFFHKFIKI